MDSASLALSDSLSPSASPPASGSVDSVSNDDDDDSFLEDEDEKDDSSLSPSSSSSYVASNSEHPYDYPYLSAESEIHRPPASDYEPGQMLLFHNQLYFNMVKPLDGKHYWVKMTPSALDKVFEMAKKQLVDQLLKTDKKKKFLARHENLRSKEARDEITVLFYTRLLHEMPLGYKLYANKGTNNKKELMLLTFDQDLGRRQWVPCTDKALKQLKRLFLESVGRKKLPEGLELTMFRASTE